MAKIVAIDDDPSVADLIRRALERGGHEVRTAGNGLLALQLIRDWAPDLVVLDLGLGVGPNGLEVCRRIRADDATANVLVIVLTGEPGIDIELALFDAGADDFVRKHEFVLSTFRARVSAVLARGRMTSVTSKRLAAGPLELDRGRRVVLAQGREVRLTPTEFHVLSSLVEHEGQVVAKDALLHRGGDGEQRDATRRTVEVHIAQIRKKLGDLAPMIKTVHGLGYEIAWPIEIEASESTSDSVASKRR